MSKRRNPPKEVDTTRRLFIAGGAGTVIFGGLTARLANLQLFNDQKFLELANENAVTRQLVPARRGLIFDRFGEPLATHRTSWNVFAARENLDDVDAILDHISTVVELTPEHRKSIVDDFNNSKSFAPVTILSDLTYEQLAQLSVERPFLPGVSIEEIAVRSYPRGRDLAHIVGYVAKPNQSEIAEATSHLDRDDEAQKAERQRIESMMLHPGTRVGRAGVERRANDWLSGEPGAHLFETNVKGRIIRRLPDDDFAPVAGSNVHLTIDAGLQKAAIERFAGESGAAVVMDVRNGDLLAFVSTPSFDPNQKGATGSSSSMPKDDEGIRTSEFNRAFDGTYPPGSTFKMVVGSAALKAGVVSPTERIFCSGKYHMGSVTKHCWKRGGHGNVDIHGALKGSCNTYFYEIARRVGQEAIAAEAKAYGLGIRYDLGIVGGKAGVVPNSEWKRRNLNQPWYPGETLDFGIGQGFLQTSPLQLAVMAARIALGTGHQVMPRLVGEGPGFQSASPENELPGPEIMAALKSGMYGVTSEYGGTAYYLGIGDIGFNDVRMAGKTGTAQVRNISKEERDNRVLKNEELPRELRDHALFVGFAPFDEPRYAIAVVAEHAGGGSSNAGPIAKDIMRQAFVRNSGRSPNFQYAQATSPSEKT